MSKMPIQPVPSSEVNVNDVTIVSSDTVEIKSADLVKQIKSLEGGTEKGLKISITITWTSK